MPNIFGRQVVQSLTNKSGGALVAGDVVIIDTGNDNAITTTTTGQYGGSVGIVQESIANNATGRVLTAGSASLVNVPSSMTRGRFLETHTVAKQATQNTTRRAGSFGQYTTSGTTPTAWLWGMTDNAGASGETVATSALWDAKGDLAAGTGADTGAKLTVGANDTFLIADSSQTTGLRWVPFTRIEYVLSGDVPMTTATTFYDGPSGVPAAGTYDVTGFACFITNQANEDGFCARLLSGSTVLDERQTGYIGPNSSGGPGSGQCSLSARVTMNGSDTLKMAVSSFSRNGGTLKRDPYALSSGLHRATMLVLVRVS